MNSQNQINNLIFQNDWEGLENYLNGEHGFIHRYLGGRYICGPFIEIDGYADINKICWNIFFEKDCSTLRDLSNEGRKALANVIRELRRLYNETDDDLKKSSHLACLVTRVYDFHEKFSKGYLPLEILENEVLFCINELDTTLKA